MEVAEGAGQRRTDHQGDKKGRRLAKMGQADLAVGYRRITTNGEPDRVFRRRDEGKLEILYEEHRPCCTMSGPEN